MARTIPAQAAADQGERSERAFAPKLRGDAPLVPLHSAGNRALVAVIAILAGKADWLGQLARQVGGSVSLRADAAVPMSGGYAEPA